jgi:hypothetical protein
MTTTELSDDLRALFDGPNYAHLARTSPCRSRHQPRKRKDQAAFITGAALPIDGGFTAQ